MNTLPRTLLVAARSEAIRPYLSVFVELHDSLDEAQFRKAPICLTAQRLRLSERHVYRVIRTLIDLGFLEPGPRLGNALTVRLTVPRSQAA